jgi:surface protein
MADLGVKFLANGEGDCVDNSNSYLSIYNNNNISSNNESKNNLKSLLSGHNDLGYTIHFSFDRNNDIALASSQTLFAAYENINPNQSEKAIAEAGITKDGKFFYRVSNGNNDKSLNIGLNSDPTMKEPHTVIIVYDQKREKIIVNIDGEESFVSNVPPLTTASNDIGQFRIGQGYIGTISLISTYSSRVTFTDRSDLAKILSKSSNNIKIKPLQKQNGVLKATAVEISAICNAGEISMKGGCVIDHCYNLSNVGSVGQSNWGRCANMLIVNETMLRDAISNNNYSITIDEGTYTFGDDGNNIFTGQVTNMSTLFQDKENFNENINYWDVSNVTDMTMMFYNANSFDQPLDNWEVDNVTSMSMMFIKANSFDQPLDNWEVDNVTSMFMMFTFTAFNRPLNSWNVSNVTNMYGMFGFASGFNQDISDWNVSNVTNMTMMFAGATSFAQDLTNWNNSTSNTDNVTGCRSFSSDAGGMTEPSFENCIP